MRERVSFMDFQEKRGIGYCGLACVLCSNKDCPGCAVEIANGHDCSRGKCAAGKGIDGCYTCPDYDSCTESKPHGKRYKAFNRYAREFGLDALIDRLRVNYENGIKYDTPDKTPGDYDVPETEDEIYQLLRYGHSDPYANCPEFDTEHFHLRLVREEDAEDLLKCYSDPKAQEFFNADNCVGDFCFDTIDQMRDYIRFWLNDYWARVYIRFSIVDKEIGKAVGTVEMCGVLRLDLASHYETRQYITELLSIIEGPVALSMQMEHLVIKAIPAAAERIAALRSAGYEPCAWAYEGEAAREYYYDKRVSL